ncbi:3-dehydroquinate synthase [Megasphaera hominis]|uniref:3-dehydroquinate synthase n=1 Tax=Megasphaera hominis TaxID=159836 RepID=A0ABR6VIW3_9FIRM|nr:3-dehydroquinate synthase [Megasphaera hominis]MBC3536655.1 3-dehydroquinate synthase [Megasphaera hominis]
MKHIHVELGKDSYDIHVGNGLLDRAGDYIRSLTHTRNIAVISDSHVDGLYGQRLEDSLAAANFTVHRIVFPAGEKNKSAASLLDLYRQLSEAGITRMDYVVAFGGGVTGDLGGFAAATFLRGLPFVQIPTSILAQVDSSVGGKVGIDLPSGKNQAGSFCQPQGVLIDPQLLRTLPPRYVHDGLGEVIKYGCITDLQLFELLEAVDEESIFSHWEEIIERCCSCKARLVERDVLDLGERMVLNFGHTIGHAIERYYDYGVYTHGEAVAAGMSMLTGMTEEMGLTQAGTTARLRHLLQRYGLPQDVDATAAELLPFISNDKKMRGQHMTLVILKEIGKARLLPLDASELPKFIRKKGAK